MNQAQVILLPVNIKFVCRQGRNITSNVYNCFEKLIFDEEDVNVGFSQNEYLTSKACSVSVQCHIFALFRSLGMHHFMPKCVTNIDDFERDILRRTILVFYEGQFPTAKIPTYMRDKIYSGSVSSMYHLLKITGLRHRNTNYGRTFLLERTDFILAQVKI
jgi:hypothetical protein